jgi:dynactin complex subunit
MIVTHLLSVYPGDNKYKDELFILPGRLNNMKNQLFSIQGSRVIGRARYIAAPLNQKVDELREAILLIKVSLHNNR